MTGEGTKDLKLSEPRGLAHAGVKIMDGYIRQPSVFLLDSLLETIGDGDPLILDIEDHFDGYCSDDARCAVLTYMYQSDADSCWKKIDLHLYPFADYAYLVHSSTCVEFLRETGVSRLEVMLSFDFY